MCFKTSSVKRFGDVYILHSTLSCIFLFHILSRFYGGDSDGGGAAAPAPPRKPAPAHGVLYAGARSVPRPS